MPRGGGLSIVVGFLLAVSCLAHSGVVPASLVSALLGGGSLLAVGNFLDDHFGLSAKVRILIHFAAAGWALWKLNGVGPLHFGSIVWDWGWLGHGIALVGLVWMINLYNFMDGIDGLAGLEAVCAGGLGGLLLAESDLKGLAASALVLAAASGGFLIWNWPPAKIFMGDVGSGFLGFVFGVLTISSSNERPRLLYPWLILLAVFIVDSTLTLIRRVFAAARWYEAHCSHAYQHAARRWGSHLKVTAAIAVVNLAWLFPLAWAACVWPLAGPVLAAIALAPLVYLGLRYDAGKNISPGQITCREAEIHVAADGIAAN
jgi:Fuc2NAc and GlcNAc transferase